MKVIPANRGRTLCSGSTFFLKIRYNLLKKVRILFKILTMTPTLLYEDKNFLALYKPAGVLVHEPKLKTKNQKLKTKPTLVDWLIKNYPEVTKVGDEPETRPGIVHRLDRDTSGVILVARNQKYFEYLKKLFQNHQIKKTYLALVWGRLMPRVGVIKKPILIKSGSVKRTIWKGRMEKEAITEYKVKKYFKDFSLVEAYPKTGRTHQIRVHLSSVGHPVAGDTLYGPKINSLGLTRQFLHAQSLEFNTAQGKRIRIDAELSPELKAVLKSLTK